MTQPARVDSSAYLGLSTIFGGLEGTALPPNALPGQLGVPSALAPPSSITGGMPAAPEAAPSSAAAFSAEPQLGMPGGAQSEAPAANPDIGPSIETPGHASSHWSSMTSEEFCKITAEVAVISVANTPPEAFILGGAYTGTAIGAGVGAGLAVASEFLSASEAAQGVASNSLEEMCNIGFDVYDAVSDTGIGFDAVGSTGSDTFGGGIGDGADFNNGDFGTGTESGGGGGDLLDGGSSADAGSSGSEASYSDTGSSSDWSGGGGEFGGAGASGAWESGSGNDSWMDTNAGSGNNDYSNTDYGSGGWSGGGGAFNGGGASGTWEGESGGSGGGSTGSDGGDGGSGGGDGGGGG